MLNIVKGQILYVISEDNTTIKKTKVADVIQRYDKSEEPNRYLDICTKYLDSTTTGTVVFRPEDFGKIIFHSEIEAKNKMIENYTKMYEQTFDWGCNDKAKYLFANAIYAIVSGKEIFEECKQNFLDYMGQLPTP